MQKQKTTLYFDQQVYMEVKKRAIDEGKTVTEYLNEVVGEHIKKMSIKKKKQTSKLLPPMKLGSKVGSVRRKDIYNYLFKK